MNARSNKRRKKRRIIEKSTKRRIIDNSATRAAILANQPTKTFRKDLDGIDLQKLAVDEPQHYCEERAYRLYNPPFPDPGHESDLEHYQQLAVVRTNEIPGNMSPITEVELERHPLPPPPPLPPFPESSNCDWKFDQTTRVLLADFLSPSLRNGKIIITPEDEQFLMTMMERDDITVVSEGLAVGIDLRLFDEDFITGRIGHNYHPKIKEFRKTESGSDVDGTYSETTTWHSMTFKDYFAYLKHASNTDENVDSMFTFEDSEGNQVNIDTKEVVLVSMR